MGFFDKFMRALGFANREELEDMEKPIKPQKKQSQNHAIRNEYNLEQETNLAYFSPSTQKEVQNIALLIKTGTNAKINLANFCHSDLLRAIDFLEGVCFALDITPTFEGTTIILKH